MRLKDLKKILANKKLNSLFLYGRDGVKEYSIEYFADAYPLSACKLIITKTSQTLFVPQMELQKMKKESKIPVKVFNKKKLNGKIGYNGNYLSVNELKSLQKNNPKAIFSDISEEIVKLRTIKTQEEIKRVQEACRITDNILKGLRKKIRSLKTERQVENFILGKIKEVGSEPSFPPIVAAGKNAANPHHCPTNEKLKGWCIIDMGVKYRGYCSDITRTWYFGKATREIKEIYNKTLRLQQQGVKLCAKNIPAKEIDLFIRKNLGKQAKFFIHSTGHSVGREIHDPGIIINSKSGVKLNENMIVTIEPGLYWPKKGGLRIEDTVLVTKPVGKTLTGFTKELLVFE